MMMIFFSKVSTITDVTNKQIKKKFNCLLLFIVAYINSVILFISKRGWKSESLTDTNEEQVLSFY